MHNEVFSKLESLEDEYVTFWAELCKIESPTDDKAAVDEAGRFIIEKAKELGFSVKLAKEELSGNPFVVTMNENNGERPLVFSAHIDTVHPKGLFGDEIVTFEDGEIHGPGVMDCKGGAVAALYAMEALKRANYTKRPIKLIIQTDEELSSKPSCKRTVDFMHECAKGCIGFINLEGSRPGFVTVERKGILRYNVEITGEARHASECFNGASAVREAAIKIIELEKMQDDGGLTFNVGKISGGTSINTVPEKCLFTLDIRFKNEEGKAFAINRTMEILSKNYNERTTTRVSLYSERAAMERTDGVNNLYERFNKALECAGLERLKAKLSLGGSDASDMTSRGIAALDSLGPSGGYIHSKKEYANVASLKESAKRLVAAALYMEA